MAAKAVYVCLNNMQKYLYTRRTLKSQMSNLLCTKCYNNSNTYLTALCPGLTTQVSQYQKGKIILDLLEQ